MFNRVKKNFVIILMAVVMSALAGCGAAKSANAAEQEKNVVEIANPFVDVNTIDEAAKIAGFTLNAPDSLAGYKGVTVKAIKKDLIQIIYGDIDHNVYFRKGVINDGYLDISGDYNDYKSITEKTVGEKNITIKGDDNLTHVIIWNDGDYCYSIQSTEGFNYEDVEILYNLSSEENLLWKTPK